MWDLRILVAAAAGLVAGFAVSGWLRPAPPEGREDAPAARERAGGEDRGDSPGAEIAALQAALDAERSLRGELELQLEILRQEMNQRSSEQAPEFTAERGRRSETQTGAAAEAAPKDDAPQKGAPGDEEWFNQSSLVARGVDEHRAAWLRERFEELQMSEIRLRNEAQREGWLRGHRYGRELGGLRAGMREEIGDEDYDLLLYAAGRNNRVVLRDVLANSPAARAGIEPGDTLLRYDGRAVLDAHELRRVTSEGKPGSTVGADLWRDGEVIRVYLPRGPLGVRLQAARRFPDEFE